MILKNGRNLSCKAIESLIKYPHKNRNVERIVTLLRTVDTRAKCYLEDGEKLVNASDIYYIEGVAKRTFQV
jgi:hypothetical protein